ncbi:MULTISPECIES: VirB4 family type IV secretion system protein [Aerococcus]|uniref:VirB4 family type IV secretion system protein n=1 Tax=Aerococcus TaxID=1375 RepID=UPI0018A6FC60|nr:MULTISPECIES: ATP-binding protein [Aerococcus]MCY3067611.1 tra protein [Aerococcus mictus]MCY3080487.1 tra protein [Aerococcus mictus]MDK8484550.1 tra protein [Aerococcus urinae]
MNLTKKQIKKYEDQGYDLRLLEEIQPEGGLAFKDRIIESGNGFVGCLHLYALADKVNQLWLAGIMSIERTIATIDVATANKYEVIDRINKTSKELRMRGNEEKHETAVSDAASTYIQLQQFAQSLSQQGEIAKLVHVRIYFYDHSQEELEKRIGDAKKDLTNRGHKFTVFEFRSSQEWDSLFQNYDQQMEWSSFRSGEVSPSVTLGAGLPFHHQSLKDPRGIYLGVTSTNGAFIFDPFLSTATRKSFNGFVLGKMGYGKSTVLKMLEEGLVAKNCFIRGFDKARDFHKLIKSQKGMIIDLAGDNGEIINPLEIFATATDLTGQQVNEFGSFMHHIAKVTNIMRFMYPSLTDMQITEFRTYLREFYIHWGLLRPDYNTNQAQVKVTGLDPKAYPIFSNFLDFLNNYSLEGHVTSGKRATLETLKTYVQEIVSQYGPLFNGHTTISDLAQESVLFFDIDNLSNLDREVFQAQLFQALTIIWSHGLINGRKMKAKLESNQITIDEYRNFMVFIDEAHNVINAQNLGAVQYVTNFMREMRKFGAGVIFATQTPAEVLPESSSNEAIDEVKKVFELCQYKILLNLDNSMVSRMKSVLGDTITETDFAKLPRLKQGEAVVQLSSTENYNVSFIPTADQLDRFAGGQ